MGMRRGNKEGVRERKRGVENRKERDTSKKGK